MNTTRQGPRLPRLLSLPLRLAPGRLNSALAAHLLERVFAEQRSDGELDFMQGRTACIRLLDAGIELGLTVRVDGFAAHRMDRPVDLTIEGTAYDFLLLITGREDPDTLFFQRRLCMSGDTALGVHLKNFLASVDLDSLPLAGVVRPGLERGLDLYQRMLG